MALPIKTYFPTLAKTTYDLSRFITKHRSVMIAICIAVDPADVVAFTAGLDAVVVFANLVTKIFELVDPDAPPHS